MVMATKVAATWGCMLCYFLANTEPAPSVGTGEFTMVPIGSGQFSTLGMPCPGLGVHAVVLQECRHSGHPEKNLLLPTCFELTQPTQQPDLE